MSSFTVVSPVGYARIEQQVARRHLGGLAGRSVGFLWNQYPTTQGFWMQLEQAIEALGKPPAVQRAYKKNTWMPLDKERFSELASQVDYLVVGVGA